MGVVGPRMDLMLGQRASAGLDALANQNALPELAIVIPTLNERANVSVLVQQLARALNGISWEAIFVDDDSADGTIDEVRRIAGRDARIRGIRRISRRGLAGAAAGRYAVYLRRIYRRNGWRLTARRNTNRGDALPAAKG